MEHSNSVLFENISDFDYDRMMICFEAKKETFPQNSTIYTYTGSPDKIGIILSGSAILERTDYDGERSVLEYLSEGDIFGETVAFAMYSSDNYSIIATKPCSVIFIQSSHFTKKCTNACQCHSTIVNNLLSIITKKSLKLSERVEILSRKTTRGKLFCYFSMLSSKTGSNEFEIPFSYTSLADYLCVDRSAMTREIKALKDEGYISADKRKFKLLT